jgi:RNA polymerase sigma-70 factor (ECF subfamily)
MQHPSQREEFLAQLYTNCYELLEKMCYRRVHYDASYADVVDDCVQEAFLAADAHYEKLSRHPNPQGWLVLTCQNRLKDALRRENRRRARSGFSIDAEDAPPLAAVEDALDKWADQQQSAELVQQVCDLLSPKEQQVMRSYFVESLSMEETARRQGSTLSAVKSIIYRIRQKARDARGRDP